MITRFLRSQRLRRWLWRALCAAAALGIAWLVLPRPRLYPDDLSYSREVRDREGQLLCLTLSGDDKYRLETPLSEIPQSVIDATLEKEDRGYFSHAGVSLSSLGRATWGVLTGNKLGGGSTLTMQYARLRYGIDTKTFQGKAEQVFRAIQLERHYSKREILEAYFRLAPYGGNVEGIGAAARLWCGKEPAQLTLREACALSVLPQSPSTRKPWSESANPSLMAAQARLYQQLCQRKGMRMDPLDAGFCLHAQSAPREAPHWTRRLLHDSSPTLDTTVDANRQRIVTEGIAAFLNTRRGIGLTNAAAILVHAPSREVIAYAGSADFLNVRIQGQVDGITAKRSPGSAIKPFIYALAMDQGLIQPNSLIDDLPDRFGGWRPENSDRGFAGPISAREALHRSRNLPAVRLTQQLRSPSLYEFLEQAGVEFDQPETYYGLALALGGGEVTLEELASLYCLLATDGSPRSLRFLTNAPQETPPPPLLSQAACFLTRRMLQSDPDHLEEEGEAPQGLAWKTGTSHGFRDAWAAGILGDYVLAVWIGNFDGRPNPHLFARDCAAPLLFELYRKLNIPVQPDVPSPGVVEADLCAVSGQLPCPHCRHRVRGYLIPGVSPIAPCTLHREVLIDPASGKRVAWDDGTRQLKREVYEFWRADQLALFKAAGLPRRQPPAWETPPPAVSSGRPRITSPQSSLTYTLRLSDEQRRSIPLSADAAPGVQRLHWFAGARFLGASKPSEPLAWQPTPGRWTLQVLDDQGHSAACSISVEMLP